MSFFLKKTWPNGIISLSSSDTDVKPMQRSPFLALLLPMPLTFGENAIFRKSRKLMTITDIEKKIYFRFRSLTLSHLREGCAFKCCLSTFYVTSEAVLHCKGLLATSFISIIQIGGPELTQFSHSIFSLQHFRFLNGAIPNVRWRF